MLPKTKEGLQQLEYTLIGIMVTTFIAGAFLFGMKVGLEYGLMRCP